MDKVTPDTTRNPDAIWLSPICDETAHHGEGRTWAAPAPADTCEDCPEPWVRYVREDLATPAPDSEKLREAKEAFQALLETHTEDDGMEGFPDEDSVGWYQSEAGEACDLPLTFGILRRARRALAALGATS